MIETAKEKRHMVNPQVCPFRLMATMITQRREDPALVNCVTEKCAWYDRRKECCAVLMIAGRFSSPADKEDFGEV